MPDPREDRQGYSGSSSTLGEAIGRSHHLASRPARRRHPDPTAPEAAARIKFGCKPAIDQLLRKWLLGAAVLQNCVDDGRHDLRMVKTRSNYLFLVPVHDKSRLQ